MGSSFIVGDLVNLLMQSCDRFGWKNKQNMLNFFFTVTSVYFYRAYVFEAACYELYVKSLKKRESARNRYFGQFKKFSGSADDEPD